MRRLCQGIVLAVGVLFVVLAVGVHGQGSVSVQIQRVLDTFVGQPNTFSGTQTFNGPVVINGTCTGPGCGTGYPVASYVIATPYTGLTNAQTLSTLTTGLLINTTSTGALTSYLGASCTNQVPTTISASGALTCSTITSAFVNATIPKIVGGFGVTLTTTATTTLTVPTSGTLATVLTAQSGSIGGVGLAAGACSTGVVTVTGATTGMSVQASPQIYPGDGTYWSAQVTAADTVTVRVCAVVPLVTPTMSNYNIRVLG